MELSLNAQSATTTNQPNKGEAWRQLESKIFCSRCDLACSDVESVAVLHVINYYL